jgi:hypothetical protein
VFIPSKVFLDSNQFYFKTKIEDFWVKCLATPFGCEKSVSFRKVLEKKPYQTSVNKIDRFLSKTFEHYPPGTMSPNDFYRFHEQFRKHWIKVLTTRREPPIDMDDWFDTKTSRFDDLDYIGTMLDHLQIRPTDEERVLMIEIFLTNDYSSQSFVSKEIVLESARDIHQDFVNGVITPNEFDGILVEKIRSLYIRDYTEEIKQVYQAHYA